MVLVLGVSAFVLTILVQGGFFARTYIPAIILLFIGGLLERKGETSLRQFPDKWLMAQEMILFSLIPAIYALSASYHETVLAQWDKVIYVSGMGVSYYYFQGMNQDERYRLKKSLVIIGMIECAIGFAAYAGLPIEGVIINARFMGTFQYANVNALFLGILLLMQLIANNMEKVTEVFFRMLQTIFFILTFSFGAMLCYVIGLFLLSQYKKEIFLVGIRELLLGGIFAGSLYLLKFRFSNLWALYGMLALILVFCVCYGKMYTEEYKTVHRYKFNVLYVRLVWCMLAIGEMLAGFCLFGSRIGGTGMERLSQMRDGLKILCQNWCLGVGAYQLEEHLKNIHADYEISLVHNSYIQIGVESGAFSLGVVLGILFLGLRRVCKLNDKHRISGEIAIIGMTVLHFCVDISFFFFPIMGILMLCLSTGTVCARK